MAEEADHRTNTVFREEADLTTITETPCHNEGEQARPDLSLINFSAITVPDGSSPPPPTTKKRKKQEAEQDWDEQPIEERLAVRELRSILYKIKEKFPKDFESVMGKRKIEKLSRIQAAGKVAELKAVIGSSVVTVLTNWGSDVVLKGSERIGTQMLGLKVEGLATVCKEDPEFQIIWDELMINTMHMVHVDPKWKLALHIIKTGALLHDENTKYEKEKARLAQEQPTSPPSFQPNNLESFTKRRNPPVSETPEKPSESEAEEEEEEDEEEEE